MPGTVARTRTVPAAVKRRVLPLTMPGPERTEKLTGSPDVALAERATVLQAPSTERLEVLDGVVLHIDEHGRISSVEAADEAAPADVELGVDIRCPERKRLEAVVAAFRDELGKIRSRRGVAIPATG